MNVSSVDTVKTNVNVAPKAKAETAKASTAGYAEKSAAPTNANLYKAMYNVKDAKAEAKKVDDEAYKRAMGEYLEKWGSDEQLNEFYGEKRYPVNQAAKNTTDPVAEKEAELAKKQADVEKSDDEAYKRAMSEYLAKWG